MVEIEPLRPEQHSLVAAWISDPDIHQWLASRWQGKVFSEQHVGVLVASPASRIFTIIDSGEPAGIVALANIDRKERSAGVWYLVDAKFRGRGLATEAVCQVVARAFDEMKMVSLNAWTTQGNDQSRRVLERVGFREVGVMRRASIRHGENVDRAIFDLLPDDFVRAVVPEARKGR
jgi:RimJ/RimL family protein N-acetyltransferase